MRIRAGVLALFLSVLNLPAAAWADCSGNPDPYYEDINGDGIDGDTGLAIFVSISAGNDANPGTMSQPVMSIAQGISLAVANSRPHVYVAAGTYNGTVGMANGVSLYGQYDGPPSWGRSNANTTTISAIGTAVSAGNITVETHLEGFTILSSSVGSGATSYGVRVVNGTGQLYIRYNNIQPGPGVNGLGGANGPAGGNGFPGGPGGPANCPGENGLGGSPGGSACGRPGGPGGNGGLPTGTSGSPGGTGTGGTPGGPGGVGCSSGFICSSEPGGNGANGTNGTDGTDGTGGSGYSISGGQYVANFGSFGAAGSLGNGGGGGGGGGGVNTFSIDAGGNGGGGGGAGGCAGTPGGGGQGGGGSIGILVYNAAAIIDGNLINTSSAGDGGNGGTGGAEGIGGSGGPGADNCSPQAGVGGNGGNGGNGGRGGHGGGGAGGASIGILISSAELVQVGSTNVYNIAAGGLGGSSAGIPGAPGISETVVGRGISSTPIVGSASPSSGSVGDTVTIPGAFFDGIPGNNQICFATGGAIAFAGSPDSLVAEVPAGAVTGRIKVTKDYLEAYSFNPFTVISSCAAAKGDMNGSGTLSGADIVLLINCTFNENGTGTVGGDCNLCYADVNCTGNLSGADIVSLIAATFNEMPFPC